MSAPQLFLDGRVSLYCGDSRDVLKTLPAASVDSVMTDPPYGLDFMGKAWDAKDGAAFAVDFWKEVLRVLKPGGHMLAFSGTRTYHRMVVAIEDAGFEIRDQFAWLYGSGFPKSLDVSKAIDKAAGARGHDASRFNAAGGEANTNGGSKFRSDHPDYVKPSGITEAARDWQGWGTAVKPAWEPLCLARKPLTGTVAANVLKHGTGAMNIDGCRVEFDGEGDETESKNKNRHADFDSGPRDNAVYGADTRARGADGNYDPTGRFPANIAHDGSDEVLAGFPDTGASSGSPRNNGEFKSNAKGFEYAHTTLGHADTGGSAARFFYTAKADAEDRIGSKHPTVKPLDLIQYYCRLITPPGGVTLDPFAGTGTTGEAAWREGFRAILIECEPEFQADIARRMDLAVKPAKRAAVAKSKNRLQGAEGTPLFGEFLP